MADVLLKEINRWLESFLRLIEPDWNSKVMRIRPEERADQHAEISRTIWNVVSLLVGACLFCLFILSGPDASLVSTDAYIKVPIVSISASYRDFLFFGPLFLIGLGLYLHVFLGQRIILGLPNPEALGETTRLPSPYIFNLKSPFASLMSTFLFYLMLPLVLAVFIWKAIPRPQDVWLPTVVFVLTSVLMLILKIRRFKREHPQLSPLSTKIMLVLLWLALATAVVLLIPTTWLTVRGQLERLSIPEGSTQRSVAAANTRYIPFFGVRRLQLFGASLSKKNLSGFFAPHADLRKADLKETDLEAADLSDADLRKADLTDANLVSANLTGARLDGAHLKGARLDHADLRKATFDDETEIDPKWKMVMCIVNGDKTTDCIGRDDLAWVDLSGADLEQSDLSQVQMTGADLRRADLTGVNFKGTNLRLADLRSTLPQSSFKDAATDGAFFAAPFRSTGSPPDVTVNIMNRLSGNCLENPSQTVDGTMLSLGGQSCDPRESLSNHLWNLSRLSNGFFRIKLPKSNDCIDSTAFYDGRPLQIWDCSDDSENQYWRMIPGVNNYVLIAKNNTGFCWTGPGSRDQHPQPSIRPCDRQDHSQFWQISFPLLPVTQKQRFPHGLYANERAEDFLAVSTRYNISPGGYYGYMYGSRWYAGGSAYRKGSTTGKSVPNHPVGSRKP
jgi:uncharacterized protein YjbI with pentapeptide repeats